MGTKRVLGKQYSEYLFDIFSGSIKECIRQNNHKYQYYGYDVQKVSIDDEIYNHLADELFEAVNKKNMTLYFLARAQNFVENTKLIQYKGYWGQVRNSGKHMHPLVKYLNDSVIDKSFYKMHNIINEELLLWTLFPVPTAEVTKELILYSIIGDCVFFVNKGTPNIDKIDHLIAASFESLVNDLPCDYMEKNDISIEHLYKQVIANLDIFGSSMVFSSGGWESGYIVLHIVSDKDSEELEFSIK